MQIKFLHTADIHIGVENHGLIDPSTGLHTRTQDFEKCLDFVYEKGMEEEIDLVAFSGDAYKNCHPSPTHQRIFASFVKKFSGAGVPFVMVVGNHDIPGAFGRATSIDIFGTLGISKVSVATGPRIFNIETKSGPIQVACLPWPTQSRLMTKDEYSGLSAFEITRKIESICADIVEKFGDELDKRIPSVLLAHVTAADAEYSKSERTAVIGRDPTLLTSVLTNSQFDYVALGHIHKFQDLNPRGRPYVVYPGSVERVDFGEEKEEKGFCLVTIKDKSEGPGVRTESEDENLSLFSEVACAKKDNRPLEREVRYEFIETPARPFITIISEVKKGEDPTQIILREIKKNDLKDAVVRVLYTVYEDVIGSVDYRAIDKALRDTGAFYVVGIIPKVEIPERIRRSEVSEELGVDEALDKYIDNTPEFEPFRKELKKYAAQLEDQLERQGENVDSSPR